ncbi:MAG TPA: IucA/IucC family protein [Acidimicrobiales bacterium]
MPALAAPVQDTHARARAEILRELVDAALADALVTLAAGPPVGGAGSISGADGAGGERWAEADLGGGRALRLRVRPATFPRAWRCAGGPVLLVEAGGAEREIEAEELVDELGRVGWDPGRPDRCGGSANRSAGSAGRAGGADAGEPPNGDGTSARPPGAARPGGDAGRPGGDARAAARPATGLVRADVAGAADAVARAADAAPGVRAELAATGLTTRTGERLAALGDRPFHPLGRHKRGWTGADDARWGPHAPEPFGLDWWAVPRAWLARSAVLPEPARLLGPADRERLADAARRHRVGVDHAVLPVHPWQARHLGGPPPGAVPLAAGLGRFRATASLRTLEPADHPDVHLKLPLAVAALGAGRQLPVRYLRNGDRAQGLLVAVARHPALAGRVHVCDEAAWWTTPAGGPGPLGDGDLGCQLRRYPTGPGAPAAGPGAARVPLGAFGVTVDGHAPALAALAEPGRGGAALAALAGALVRLAIVSLAHGVMPELHGQNVVVAVRPGPTPAARVAGLVLRDHDAVRIHPAWLRAAGLPDPGYVVDGRTPNTLVAGSPAALLGWFQMLGVHLGLYPIVRALGPDEAAGWRTVAAATRVALDELEAWDGGDAAGGAGALALGPAVAVARRQLLEAPAWPVKLVLGPLLERGATCGTSMPSAVGTAANPLRVVGA